MVQLGELMMILELHRQGLSVAAIARRTGRDRKTVRKYIERGIVGWTKQMRLTALVCILASLWAASNAYLDAAGRELLANQHGQTVYADADRLIAELEAEAASFRELALEEGARGGCKANCRALTAQAAEASQRLQEARKARSALKPVEASGFAVMVAMVAGGDPNRIARGLGAVKATLFIALVEALVWLSVPAVALLGAALSQRRSDVIDLQPIGGARPRITAKAGTKEYYRQRLQREHPRCATASTLACD
jgi:hypothetical protein